MLARVQAATGRESLHIPAYPPQPVQPSQPDRGNPQTDALLALLGLPHRWTVPSSATPAVATVDPNELSIDDEDEVRGEGIADSNQRNNDNERDANEICISEVESDCDNDGVALEDECIVFKPTCQSSSRRSERSSVTGTVVGGRIPGAGACDVIDFDNYDDSAPPSFMAFAKK